MQNILTAGNATSNLSTAAGDDGTFKIVVGPNGSQVDALAFSAAGVPTFAQGFASSKTGNGYQKLPSGLIIQWGSLTTSAGGSAVTFPLAFTTAVASIGATVNQAYNGTVATSGASVSGFTVNVYAANTGSGVGAAVNWIAIGY